MYFHYLWHSEGIIEIDNSRNETVRILLDSWLSDYSIWDLMERSPRISIDYSTLPSLDALFISHSHTDHLDPYSLLEIYKHQSPLLLLPETLSFLEPLFLEYIPTIQIKILKHRELFTLKGVEVYGIVFKNDTIGNEEDVMTISIANNKEIAYFEVDTLPPDDADEQQTLYKLFTKRPFETILYVATRNELEWNLKLLDFESLEERKRFEKEYRKKRIAEMEWQYEKFDYEEYQYPDITGIPGFMRVFIGQWLQYPAKYDKELSDTKIMKLDEVVTLEREIAKKYDRDLVQEFFRPGKSYEIKPNNIKKLGSISFLKEEILMEQWRPLASSNRRYYASGPLLDEKRNLEKQKELILEILNTRFLPAMLSNQHDNLKDILLESPDHRYRILVRFGNKDSFSETIFSYGFNSMRFEVEEEKSLISQEDYWANDLEDFYEGRQELYCNFLHVLDPKKAYRLWTLLGNNFLNNDLIFKKYKLHFELARKWRTSTYWVESFYPKMS